MAHGHGWGLSIPPPCPKKRLPLHASACFHPRVPLTDVKHRLTLLLLLFTCALVASAVTAPLSGTKTVGPTGNYASLTAAIADIQAQSLGGALVLELQPAYVSTVETFPLTVPALNGASAVNTVTIRPASGAAGLSITSTDTPAATVNLNGAQFVTFDGRPGGAGTAKQLTIANTSTSGVAVRFINEGSSNTLRYLTLQGVNTSATSGANGNAGNTIDRCVFFLCVTAKAHFRCRKRDSSFTSGL